MKQQKKSRLIIIDDHAMMSESLARALNDEPNLEVVGKAHDAVSARNLVYDERPDILIVDFDLGADSATGMEVIEHARTALPEAVIVMVTGLADRRKADRARKIGANAFVAKAEPTSEILRAIKAGQRGQPYVTPTINAQLVGPEGHPADARLSHREMEVFRLIGRGKTSAEIAELLSIASKTVDNHKGSIKEKLSYDSHTRLVIGAVEYVRSQPG